MHPLGPLKYVLISKLSFQGTNIFAHSLASAATLPITSASAAAPKPAVQSIEGHTSLV